MTKKHLTIILCTLCTLTLIILSLIPFVPTVVKHSDDDLLEVHFIDVAQGDSTLLKSGDSYVLIDAGEKDYGETVCDYISTLGATTIDYVICTHPHSDHCGGLTQVIETFDCKNFITVESDQQTHVWLDVLYAVDNRNVNYIDAKVGDKYTFGDSTFTIIGPCFDDYIDYNNLSVSVKVECGDTSFVMTGDAEAMAERDMLQSGIDLSADVLKIGHHGSYTSTCEEFLSAVNPSYGIISCALYNDYGHPHNEVKERLNQHGVSTYCTANRGTIVATSNAYSIDFTFEKEDDTTDKQHPSHSKKSQQETQPVTQPQNQSEHYVGNIKSRKFHLPTCDGAQNTKEKNKIYFDTRQDAVDNGYSACHNCNP